MREKEVKKESKKFINLIIRYHEKQPGKFVGDTKCEKLPIELCGQGCEVVPGPEECHDKEIAAVIEVPEEICDLVSILLKNSYNLLMG